MERVGQRVQVFWPEETDWFSGVVQEFDAEAGYFIVYDDGDERWETELHLLRFQDQDGGGQDDSEDEREVKGAGAGADDPCEDEGHDRDITPGRGDTDDSAATRQALEPPESPTGAYEDDYDDTEDVVAEGLEAMPIPIPEAQSEHCGGDDGYESDPEVEMHSLNDDTKQGVLSDGDGNSEGEERNQHAMFSARDPSQAFRALEVADLIDIDDELEQSIAASEVPETCAAQREVGYLRADRLVPERGRLFGKVLRATDLPLVNGQASSATVKISFAEAGDASGASGLMLRCKRTLGSTSIAAPSSHPVWVDEEELEDDWSVDNRTSPVHFQLDLAPPKPASVSLWDRVVGDLVLTVYSVEMGAQSVFLGQAVVALADLLRGLLSLSPSTTRCLRLCTRSGKPLPTLAGSAGPAELVVAFHLAPTFTIEAKHRRLDPTRSSESIRSSRSRQDDAKSSARPRRSEQQQQQRQQLKAGIKTWARQRQAEPPSKSASSGINRRRFERQVAKENVDFAKRLEWQEARRARVQADAQAQEKRGVTPPQHGARKHGHKASSAINRSKFVGHVQQENRAMGKRLLAIGSKACKASPLPQPTGFGGCEQDKVLLADKRQERKQELDFRLQQAQASYAKQHELVAEVTALQDGVALLRQQTVELSRACGRLDVLVRKDRHTRDCLRNAVDKQRSAVDASRHSTAPVAQRTSSRTVDRQPESADSKRQGECELLEAERDRIETEKQRHREQLQALEQERTRVGDVAGALEASLRRVVAQRAFSSALRSGKNPKQVQAAMQQMKRRLRAKDLSKEEEEQWALFQAHEELAQLQLAVQALEHRASMPATAPATDSRRDSSSTATAYLASKIESVTSKLQAQQAQAESCRRECETLVSTGKYETLRAQVQELQHLVFLCRSQSSHYRRADKTQRRKETASEQRKLVDQTETD